MMGCISTNSQGSHTVSKKNQRKFRKMILDQAVDCMDILQHGICSTAVHISQVFFAPHTLSVATVIMDHTYIFPFCHIFHKRKITFLIFTHPMNNLDDPTVLLVTSQFRHHCQTGNFQSVCFWREWVLNCSHHISPHLFLLLFPQPQPFFCILEYIITQGVSQTVNLCYNRYGKPDVLRFTPYPVTLYLVYLTRKPRWLIVRRNNEYRRQ